MMTGTLGIKAAFLTSKHKQEIEHIAAHNGLKIHYFTDEADLDASIGQCEILYGYIPPEKLRQAESLRWLACASSGVEQYLADYLYAAPGVILTNSAGAYGITISEHILMTALMLLRRMPEYTAVTAAHRWENLGRIRSMYGSVITVVGTGDIGTAFAQRAKALGAAHIRGVHRTNRLLPRCYDESYAVEDLDFALAGADIVVLCVPETRETENLITRERLGLLKKTSILINVGRGSVLDQDALMDLLNSGKIAGAALDVTTPEPLPADHPLWHTKNLIITPHISGNMTLDITCDLDVSIFCDNLTRYCRKQPMKHVVERSVGY